MLFVPYFNTVLLAEVARRLAAAHADPVPREGDERDRVPEHRDPPVWKSTSVSGATPPSRRRIDGVEGDATIQHEGAVNF